MFVMNVLALLGTSCLLDIFFCYAPCAMPMGWQNKTIILLLLLFMLRLLSLFLTKVAVW